MHKIKTILASALIAMSTECSAKDLCAPSGYTVSFFNGVWNSLSDASESKEKIHILLGDTYNGYPIKYGLLYNETGPALGATAMQDIAEVFEQRAAELLYSNSP